MASCTFIPSKGAGLFTSLKKDFGYQTAREIFLRGINPDFIKDHRKVLDLDKEGVPTKESLMRTGYMQNLIGSIKITDSLHSKYPPRDNTRENYSVMMDQARGFNANSEYNNRFTALVETERDKLVIKFVPKTKESARQFNDRYSALKVNRSLGAMFGELGVTAEMLSDAEVNAGRTGMTDFSKARNMAGQFSGLIRVANNMEGEVALTEEFSHVLVGIFHDSPLVTRGLTVLSSSPEALQKILGDQYEDTVKFQNGDMRLVAEEALGKLLRDNLVKETTLKDTPAPSLFRRIMDFIKDAFRKYRSSDVDKLITDANQSMGDFAKRILDSTFEVSEEDIADAERNAQFNALSDTIDRRIDILKNALKTELKRSKIYSSDNKTTVNNLYIALQDENTLEGILEYAKSALSNMTYAYEKIDDIQSNLNNLDKDENPFAIIRECSTILESYAEFVTSLSEMLDGTKDEQDMTEEEKKIIDELKDIYNQLTSCSNLLGNKIRKNFVPAFAEFLKPFIGTEITITSGENAGKKITIEELLKKAEMDISFMDRWIDSMADSSDEILQALDLAVKNTMDTVRKKTTDKIKEIQRWRMKAEKAGITSFEWVFEKDRNGHKSGRYISKTNIVNYELDRKEMLKELDRKYGKNAKGQNAKDKIAERNKWYDIHAASRFDKGHPNEELYRNKDYERLSDTQKELLDEFLKMKEEADKKYPEDTVDILKAIQIRKSGAQRIMDSAKSPGTLFEQLRNHFAEKLFDKEDDVQMFGDVRIKKGITDFAGREYMTIPTLYTTLLKNPDELSDDIVGSLIQYTYATTLFEEMNKIVDPLEVGRMVLRNRDIQKTQGGKAVGERINALGFDFINPAYKQGNSNIFQKYEDFLESHVYLRYLKDQGSVEILGKSVNVNKTVEAFMGLSSMVQLGFNFLANLANVATGISMQNIEAIAGQFFNVKELKKADGIYIKNIASVVAELGDRNKKNKLSLLDELLNIDQTFTSDIKRVQKKSLLERIFGSNISFIGQRAGDHWLYNRTAIAMCLRMKVNVPGKGEMNLWDALEVRDKFEDNDQIKELVLPEGTTMADGSAVDLAKFGRKIADVNQHLFGIYNEEDANAANRVAIGRLLMQYRKWMKPQLNRRFEKRRYNLIQEEEEEGYYRTLLRMANELRRGQFQIGAQWKNMKKWERQNIVRALTEISQFIAVVALVHWVEWPDDKNRPLALKLAEYAARRLEHELGNLTPSPIMPLEAYKTVSSPMASLSTVNSILRLFKSVCSPEDWTYVMQSGPYKGYTRLEKNLLKAPIPILSHYRQIERALDDIDTSIDFYIRSY